MSKYILALSVFFIPLETISLHVQPPNEDDCLALAVYHEARGEPLEGQKAVLQVIENRMRVQGKSACRVIMQRRQFSFFDYNSTMNVTEAMLTNLERLRRMAPVIGNDVLYYHTKDVKPIWRLRLVVVRVIGNHVFYKERM